MSKLTFGDKELIDKQVVTIRTKFWDRVTAMESANIVTNETPLNVLIGAVLEHLADSYTTLDERKTTTFKRLK